MLSEREISAIRKGKWEIDCQQIWLSDAMNDSPIDVQGPGALRQDRDGGISFKFFADSSAESRLNKIGPTTLAGTVLDDQHFVILRAIDAQGRQWISHRPHVDSSISYCTSPPTFSVSGFIYEMKCDAPADSRERRGGMRIWLRTKGKLACNAGTETATSIAGKKRSSKADRNVACFSSRKINFEAQKGEGDVLVLADFEGPSPPNLAVDLVCALQFVTAKPVDWFLLESSAEDGKQLCLRARRAFPKRTRLNPPVNHLAEVDVWRLFDAFFRFMADERSKLCFEHLSVVLEASANSISVMLREISIAIEGLTKLLYGESATPSQPFLKAVRCVESYLNAWPGTNDKLQDSQIRSRLTNLIGLLKNESATDRLRGLVATKVIGIRHYDAWKASRNPSAHGNIPHTRDFQEHVDQWNSLTVLLYHLIFHTAGYCGQFVDYSERGWPVRAYPTYLCDRLDEAPTAPSVKKAGRGLNKGRSQKKKPRRK